MTNISKPFPHQRRTPRPSTTVAAPVDVAPPAVSPADFYQELTVRDDVRRILTRLAQVEDGQA